MSQNFFNILPCGKKKDRDQILGFIKDKVIGRIKSWNNRFLSRAGREILLKNVLQAIPSYAMSIFLLPQDVCHNIELALNKLWWIGQAENSKGIKWRRWDDLCKLKAVGGMGFRKLRPFNLAQLGKQAWRFIHYPDSLVSRVFKAKYFKNTSFMEAKLGSNPSFVWRSILESQPVLKGNCSWRVGDGRSISVWNDPWLPGLSSQFIMTPMPEHLAEAKVHSLLDMQGSNWDIELIDDIFEPADETRL